MVELVFGDSLEREPGEAAALADTVAQGKLQAQLVHSHDGDVRYWAVDPSQNPILQRLMDYAYDNFESTTGRPPDRAFLMVNHVTAEDCPEGSGGGWHRDSFSKQYKAFVYLTEVESESQGPLCLLRGSNHWLVRLTSILHRLATGGHRFSDRTIRALERLGLESEVVLAPPGIPFFADTTLIHRGLPIVEGERVAATVYMFDEDNPPFEVEGQVIE